MSKSLYLLIFISALVRSADAQQQSLPFFETFSNQHGFLKNIGQVRDFNAKPVEFVYYQAKLDGRQHAFITNYGLSVLLSIPKKTKRVRNEPGTLHAPGIPKKQDSSTIITWDLERIDIVLKDASILPSNIEASANEQSPTFNFYIDNTYSGQQQLLMQKEILIHNVYPGIDWKVYISEENGKPVNLKYDFIIHPGADISRIKIQYSGATKMQLVNDELMIQSRMGNLKEQKPFSYLLENKSKVPVAFLLKKNIVSFNAGDYDKNKTLVIDPSIFWMTYLSSTSNVWAYNSIFGSDIETDADGNIFVQLTAQNNIPFPVLNPGGGAYYQDYTASPNGAMILIKFAPGGQMLWSTFFGDAVKAVQMTIDKFGNIVTIGELVNNVSTGPDPVHTVPLLDNGGFYDALQKDKFISKFSNTGLLLWSSFYANFETYPTDMTYDSNGNVYVVGWSESYDFPNVDPGGGAYAITNPLYGYAQVLFISQFDAANNLIWSTRIEGNDFDPYARVCIDKTGNIYLAGQARSTNYPMVDAGGYFETAIGDDVITKFNQARQMKWSTHINSSFTCSDLTTDDSCNLYVVSAKNILKFDSSTNLIYETSVNTTRMHFWNKINYDPVHDQIHLLGVMNDFEYDFPTINTACNGSFFNNGSSPNVFGSATDPIFATINHDGQFSYRSLADWVYEYYDESEMAVDKNGDLLYLFFQQQDGYNLPNPQLTDPGNGAYFDNHCCVGDDNNSSALLLKLISSELTVNTDITLPTGCSCNGAVNVSTICGQSPFTYQWSNGSNTASVSGLCPGNYWVRVSDANHLTNITYLTIPFPPGSISAITPAIIPENCNRSNGTITIQSVTGGLLPFSYSPDAVNYSASPQFTGLDSGNHIIHIRDANGCVYTDTLLVPRIQGPAEIIYDVQKSTCMANDGQLQVTNVQGGISPYLFSLVGYPVNNTGLFINLAAGGYQLTVSDTAGCSITKNIVVQKEVPATDAVLNISNDHCTQSIGSIEINNIIGGMAPFTWSTDSITFFNGIISNLAPGSYNVYIRDNNGCVFTKTPVIIQNNEGPATCTSTIENAYCGKLTGTVQVNAVSGGVAPYGYAVDGNIYSSGNSFIGILPGIHDIHVKDAFGCVYSQTFEIAFKPVARITLAPQDTLVCYDEMVPLKLSGDINQATDITWNVPAQGSTATVEANENKKIIVSITDVNNCLIKDTGIIKVKACNIPEKCLAIPNAFTPNRDGKNEFIGPIVNGCRILSIHFKVYDRWGVLMFETNGVGKGWDGNYKGNPQSAGAYIYTCEYIADDRVTRLQKGSLMLIR